MPEDDPAEPFVVPEIFVDGFTKHTASDGVMTCVGYRKLPEGLITVVKLVWPVVNTGAAIERANAAMNNINEVVPTKAGGSKRGLH